jgi:hypothetical protein
LGSVDAFADPQLAPGCPVPEGFLAALNAHAGAARRFERVLGCADGAVGLSPQAASTARPKRRASDFIGDSSEMSGSANTIESRFASTRGAGSVHFKGHSRRSTRAISRAPECIHRAEVDCLRIQMVTPRLAFHLNLPRAEWTNRMLRV